MNKQEAIEKIEKEKSDLNAWEDLTRNRALDDALAIVRKLDEPEKPVVPQVAVEFYERYKDDNLALGEWFGDFYSHEAIEEFPRMDELTKWLHDNNDETNRQRELALATLVTLGIDAVEVEEEKRYTVELPNPNRTNVSLVLGLYNDDKVAILAVFADTWKYEKRYKLTEAEIKKDFEWAWQFAEPEEVNNNDD